MHVSIPIFDKTLIVASCPMQILDFNQENHVFCVSELYLPFLCMLFPFFFFLFQCLGAVVLSMAAGNGFPVFLYPLLFP